MIDFYFDFMSPYSYFAWKNLNTNYGHILNQLKLKPVVFSQLLNHYELKGPGEIDPKREFLLRQMMRYAKSKNIDFNTPASHPFNPLYALRLACLSCSKGQQSHVIDSIWHYGWVDGGELGDPEALTKGLIDSGIDNAEQLMEKTFERSVKSELKQNTKEAIAKGCWGVPSFILPSGELFWGNDSLAELSLSIGNNDTLDWAEYNRRVEQTPRRASQKLE